MTGESSQRPGSIIPPEAAPLRTLTATMTVMCYLACLAIGALILIDRAVDNWARGLSREITVQVRETSASNIEAELKKTIGLLRDTAGVTSVQDLGLEAAQKLLEPWLGTDGLANLPVPRLLRVTVDEARPPNYIALTDRLAREIPAASLDTHRRWEAELKRMAGTLSLLSYMILALIGGSAVAMVIFATRAVLDANRQIVEVLHLVGARDGYIARQIDRRFVVTGLWAGILGVILGLVTFLALGLSGAPQVNGLAAASRSLFFAPVNGTWWSYLALLAVPVTATLIALVTSRLTLVRMLKEAP